MVSTDRQPAARRRVGAALVVALIASSFASAARAQNYKEIAANPQSASLRGKANTIMRSPGAANPECGRPLPAE